MTNTTTRQLQATDGITAMTTWFKSMINSGNFTRWQEYLDTKPGSTGPNLQLKPIPSKKGLHATQGLEFQTLNDEMQELEIRKVYAEGNEKCEMDLFHTKAIKVNVTYALVNDPNDSTGATTIPGPIGRLNDVEKAVHVKEEIVKTQFKINQLKDKHKKQITEFEELQKAAETHNKERDHIINRMSKALNEMRSDKWMSKWWQDHTKECTTVQELFLKVHTIASGIKEIDTKSLWRSSETKLQGTYYHSVDQLFIDFKELWDTYESAYPNEPLNCEKRREMVVTAVDKLQQTLAPIIKDDAVSGHILSNLMNDIRENDCSN
ncbi:hypothetical protein BCR33DRAFT_750322, partial [Rhizoclosmatium globosum]